MKKIVFLLAMTFIINIAYSQKIVNSAASSMNKGLLDKAKSLIDLAITEPEAKDLPKTWKTRGDIYLKIHQSTEANYKNLDTNALVVSYNSFLKAMELDTKNEIAKSITLTMLQVKQAFYDKGVDFYNVANYKRAMEFFETTAQVSEKMNDVDSLSIYNAALCAEYAGIFKNAEESYKKLIAMKYQKANIYSNLAGVYRNLFMEDNPYKKIDIGSDTNEIVKLVGKPDKVSKTKINTTTYLDWTYKSKLKLLFEYGKLAYYNTDSVTSNLASYNKGMEVIEQGLKIFPNDNDIYIAKANLSLTAGKFDIAKEALETLKQNDPSNPDVHYAIGNAYFDQYNNESINVDSRLKAYEESVKALKKSIELKSDYFEAVYMLGAIFFNEGIRLEQESEGYISDMKKYNATKAKFDVLYNDATSYLEKADVIKPNDYNTLIALRKLYSRLNLNDKYNAINEKLKSMN